MREVQIILTSQHPVTDKEFLVAWHAVKDAIDDLVDDRDIHFGMEVK